MGEDHFKFTSCELRVLSVVRFRYPDFRLPLFPWAQFLRSDAERIGAGREAPARPARIWRTSRDRIAGEIRQGFPSGRAATNSRLEVRGEIPRLSVPARGTQNVLRDRSARCR